MLSHIMIAAVMVVSIALQAWAFILSWSLARKGHGHHALSWGLLAAGLLLMTLRRLASLLQYALHGFPSSSLPIEMIALVISSVFFAGLLLVRRDLSDAESVTRLTNEQLQRYRAYIRMGPDAVVVLNHEGRVLEMNGMAEEVTGRRSVVMLGLRFLTLVPKSDRRRAIGRFSEAFSLGRLESNLSLQRPDGEVRLIAFSMTRLDEQRFIAFFRDETARISAQRQLHSEARQKSLILKNIAEGVMYLDADLKTVWSNFSDNESIDAASLPPEACYCASAEDNCKPCPSCPAAICLERGERQVAELKSLDGKDLRIHSVPLNGEGNEIVGIVQTVLDVTESRRLQRELRENAERLRLAMDSGSLSSVDLNVLTGDVLLDEGWTRILACQAQELPHTITQLMEWVHKDDVEHVQARLAHCINSADEKFSVEQRVTARDGTLRWLACNGAAVKRDVSGRAERLVWVCHDITARREVETEQMLRKQEMAYMSRVATMAEVSVSLAHELNQPLGAILANAKAAERLMDREQPDLAEARDALQDISADSARAGEVIHRLRKLLSKSVADFVPVDIPELVRDTLQLLHSEFALRSISVVADLPDESVKVRGDRVQLQQVLVNLLLNACEAMAESGTVRREIRVSTRLRAEKNRLDLLVSDSGPGIKEEDLDRVYEIFYTTKPNGMGAGLAITRSIMESHGGRLWAENNRYGGATFGVAIPLPGKF